MPLWGSNRPTKTASDDKLATGLISMIFVSTPPKWIASLSFLIPSFIRIPFTGDTLKDQLEFVFFTDVGIGEIEEPLAGEDEDKTMAGTGVGIRMLKYKGVSMRLEWGSVLGDESVFGGDNRFYAGVQK